MSTLAYFAMTSMAIIANKYLLATFDFRMIFLYLCLQSFIAICLFQIAVYFKLLEYSRRPTRRDFMHWMPVSTVLVTMVFTGSRALEHSSIPIFMTFKHLSTVVVAISDALMFNVQLSRVRMTAIGCMMASCMMLTMCDTQSSILWLTLNGLCTGIFALVMKSSARKMRLRDPLDSCFYNNIMAVPIMFTLSLLVDDWNGFKAYDWQSAQGQSEKVFLIVAVLVFGICSAGVSYSSSLCAQQMDHTWYRLVSAVNKLPMMLTSLLFFESTDAHTSIPVLISVAISFIANVVWNVANHADPSNDLKHSSAVKIVGTKSLDENVLPTHADNSNNSHDHNYKLAKTFSVELNPEHVPRMPPPGEFRKIATASRHHENDELSHGYIDFIVLDYEAHAGHHTALLH